ncbi:hypothetical protein GYA37_02800 [candidate division WWE3 bacterium]|uniref:Uncharacterized protein n=1 Tax=candidate division WWE3 bacterium TaxID=2053526 RepID=A0A7X9E7K8_UNCKA|nr:hypothetical protein [candidate division WWE3 bacterium]
MKDFIKILIAFITVLLLWAAIGVKKLDRNNFLSSSTLDMSRPLNVTIDVEFINKLNPAYGK